MLRSSPLFRFGVRSRRSRDVLLKRLYRRRLKTGMAALRAKPLARSAVTGSDLNNEGILSMTNLKLRIFFFIIGMIGGVALA